MEHLVTSVNFEICFYLVRFYLDIFCLVFEVNPRVGVAPDQNGEKEGADNSRHQHDEQAKQSFPTGSIQCIVVKPKEFFLNFCYGCHIHSKFVHVFRNVQNIN